MLTQAQATALIARGIATGEYPARVFKYRKFDNHTESLFRDHRLWFANPLSFNDPFDCQIQDVSAYTRDEVYNYLIGRAGASPTQAAHIADNHQLNPALFTQALEAVKQGVFATKGILSLSEIPDNILMWSHYADSHTGFALGFNIADDIPFFTTPHHVNYQQNYPAFQYVNETDKLVSHGMLTKSHLWSYEREIRVLKNCQGLQSFDKRCVAEIILGCRISDANKALIFDYVRRFAYDHVAVMQARVSSSRYDLDLSRITVP